MLDKERLDKLHYQLSLNLIKDTNFIFINFCLICFDYNFTEKLYQKTNALDKNSVCSWYIHT